MIETEIAVTVNRKSDFDLIQQKIIESKMQFPIYIREYEFSYQINFASDYEQWELDTAILDCFPDYEYTTDLEKGRKEIRIQISRYQSELSTDGWGRPIENPLNQIKYLVKKSVKTVEKFNPKIKVLFENKEQYYYINIVAGINKATNEQVFLLIDDFKTNNEDKNAEVLKNVLYQSPLDAFHSGFHKLSTLVDTDFCLYLDNKKKEIREAQKLPRKIIRDFVKGCNISDENEILKNLHENIIFEKLIKWKTIVKTDGISELKEYLNSPNQELTGRDFKIRSSWDFFMPTVTIGIKYFPLVSNELKAVENYGQIKFTLKDNKIISIVYEN